MIEGMAFKAASLMAGITSPKNLISLAKYMYIKKLLDHHRIELILDVGANVGQFAKSMRRIGYKGSIISFEPVSTAFERLTSVARGDSKWRTCKFALGAAPSRQTINVMAASVFSSFNKPSPAQPQAFVDDNRVLGTEVVELRKLSDVAREFGFEATLGRAFLKCDTQGFDMQVLKGAGQLLHAVRMLQVELSATQIYEGPPGMTEVLQFVEQYGFAPVAFFPINKMPDWSAAELDYLGVNRTVDN
jgi:FkbM family methyltransferase